ncbi:hypothetical protein SMIE22_18100 [Streptococcus mitis]
MENTDLTLKQENVSLDIDVDVDLDAILIGRNQPSQRRC